MKTLLPILILFLAHLGAIGQEKEVLTPEEIATRQTEKMQRILELSPEQKEAVYTVNLDVAKRSLIIPEYSTTEKDLAEERSLLRNEQFNRINDILMPEQRKTFKAANERYQLRKSEVEHKEE